MLGGLEEIFPNVFATLTCLKQAINIFIYLLQNGHDSSILIFYSCSILLVVILPLISPQAKTFIQSSKYSFQIPLKNLALGCDGYCQ